MSLYKKILNQMTFILKKCVQVYSIIDSKTTQTGKNFPAKFMMWSLAISLL